jgi:4-amino-4-deoxy-L-arabinose transferase-like glycosyltransferase
MQRKLYSQVAYEPESPTASGSVVVPDADRGKLILLRILQSVLCLLGVACIGWAFSAARFRDAEGFLRGSICLPIAIGIALMILGWALAGPSRRFAFWFSLALVGQAVVLQTIDAGPAMKYQHYRALDHPALLGFLGVQTAVVVAGYKNRWRPLWSWIRLHFKAWQLLGIGLLFFVSSATVSEVISSYLVELPFAAFLQAVNLANVVLVVWTIPSEAVDWFKRRSEKFLGPMEGEQTNTRASIDRLTILAAIWVTILAATFSFYSYGRHPHISDEVGYVLQARYFAAGMLTMPAPPVPAAFEVNLMNYEESRWYSAFSPLGWPLALAVGVLLGAPWLVNPILAGVNVLGIAVLLRELYDRRTARIVVLLLCFSPWFVFMGMNFMSHTFTLTCALAAALALIWARKTGKVTWALASGCAIGLVSLIRPLEGLVMALLLGLWAIGVGRQRLKTLSVAALILGAMIVGSLVLPYNKHLTGKATQFPVNAYSDKYFWPNANAMGFGPERGMGWPHIDPHPGHTPVDALINANLNTTSINFELLGWSTGSLLLILLFVFSGALRGSDWLMLSVVVAVFVAHFFYWFSGGPDFGARYWYLMLIPCMALTARGIQFLETKLRAGPSILSARSTLVIVAVFLLCASTLVNYFPWRAIDKYHNYLGLRPDVRYLAREYDFGKSLVLVQGNARPDYASAAVYNPIDLRADAPVFAWDQDAKVRSEVLQAYADRPVWIIAGPSITGGAFKVIEGPITADKLAAREK